MASSSVSQESLDINEDYELNARRSRIRTLRARGALPRAGDRDSETSGDRDMWDMNGDDGVTPTPTPVGGVLGDQGVHDSPTRSAVQRAKDKRTRPNHLQKGKLPKDKRKLREKRRSTGVVHLASTESTGDSLDDDDDDGDKGLSEAKLNKACNEVIDADNPQTPSEVMRRIQQFQSLTIATTTAAPPKVSHTESVPKGFAVRRNKSPSDLEADLEDNQDYDSCVSQSDSNLTLIDQSRSRETDHPPSVPPRTSYQSNYSSEPTQSFRSSYVSQKEPETKYGGVTSSQQSMLSKYRTSSTENEPQFKLSSQPRSPKSPKSPQSSANQNLVREPMRPVASVLSRYQVQEKSSEESGPGSGYRSRFRDRDGIGVRGPVGQQFATSLLNKENKEDDVAKKRLEKDLERERDENRRLQKVLEEKDRRIAELERQIAMMNRDLGDFEEENEKLIIENRALISAVGQLSTNV